MILGQSEQGFAGRVPSVPDTPAGQRLAEWLAVFNSGDVKAAGRYVQEAVSEQALKRAPAPAWAFMQAFDHALSRGFDLVST